MGIGGHALLVIFVTIMHTHLFLM